MGVSTGGRSRVFYPDLLSPLEMGAESEERPQRRRSATEVEMRMVDWTWRCWGDVEI